MSLTSRSRFQAVVIILSLIVSASALAQPDVIIDLSELTLYVEKNQKSYPIAAGKLDGKNTSFTPTGTFSVIEKNPHPVCTLPDYAPDTYGARFILLDVMGRYNMRRIGIHGTNQPDSIGTYISSGCIRMHNKDIEEIYPLIPHHASVEIRE